MIDDDPAGVSLLQAVFSAPLIGCDSSEAPPITLHAITVDEIVARWGTSAATAVCGAGDLRILKVRDEPVLYEWPPSTRYMPKKFHRCADCHRATGRKRPRSRWKPAR
jgi:hypothetical protein